MSTRLLRLLALSFLLAPALAFALPPVPDVYAIMRQAQCRVNAYPIYARATLRSATGTTAGGGTTSSTGIVNWTFVYDNTPTPPRVSPPILSVSISCHTRTFTTVTPGLALPPTSVDIIPLTVMPLSNAVRLIQKAGVNGAFTSVQLIYIPSPTVTHPNYIFTLALGGTASIDTITAKVTITP
jgi:hypothetical protein